MLKMLKYSIPQLLKHNNCIIPTCISAVKLLGLLRRPRYIHRSSHRKFVYSQPGHSVPSIWSAEYTVAPLPRHQNTVALGTSSTGNTARSLHTKQDKKRGVDFSLQVQRSTTSSNIKIELLNAQSLANKASLIHEHILDKGIDFMCLTETWHWPKAYDTLNEPVPLATVTWRKPAVLVIVAVA